MNLILFQKANVGRVKPKFGSKRRQHILKAAAGRPDKKTGWAPGLTELPKKESLREYIKGSDGPPRISSPLPPPDLKREDPTKLPLLIILPGIDGTGYTAASQFPELIKKFDLKTLFIPVDDRTKLMDLVEILSNYVEHEISLSSEKRPIYVMGESFGGILALLLGKACGPLAINRLVLVNPATSFSKSLWPSFGPLLPDLPEFAYDLLPIAISPLLGNPLNLALRNVEKDDTPANQAVQAVTGLIRLLPVLDNLTEILPPDTLSWKLSLLAEGSEMMEDVLPHVKQRVLVVAGDQDLLIPSKEESERLKRSLRKCSVKIVEGAGHALMQEANVCMSSILDETGFYKHHLEFSSPRQMKRAVGNGKAADYSEPLEVPTATETRKVCEEIGLNRMKELLSPTFFSTSETGKVVSGLDYIPKDRPIVVISNHQTMALDLGFLVSGVLEKKGILLRGLAHPSIFQNGSTTGTEGIARLFTEFGAVPVNPRNMFKLLRNKEVLLLFPGGAREALKGRDEEYQLFWPEEAEFVRIAAKFNATILPLSGVGIDDSIDFIATSEEMTKLPVFGDLLQRNITRVQKVREDETLVFPLTRPKAPKRLYFKFGKPIQLSSDLVDKKEECEEIYRNTKQEVEDGIQYLLNRRENDPYKDIIPRMIYERSKSEQAPTFRT